MSVSRFIEVQLVVCFVPVFQCCCLNNQGISKYLKTLILLSPNVCFIIGFICDLSVVRNDLWMS